MKNLFIFGSTQAPLSDHLEAICDRFEEVWREVLAGGPRPRLEDFLAGIAEPELQALLIELLQLEVGYRRQLRETPTLQEYQQRFPGLPMEWLTQLLTLREEGVTVPPPAAETAINPPKQEDFTPTPSKIRCPHCHSPIQLAKESEEVLCPGCGSSFRLRDAQSTETAGGMKQMGKFQLLERLGVGAFGAVWKARDTDLKRIVALKIPHTGLLTAAEELERFQREARAAAQLRHPNIVTVYEVTILNGLPVIVAEYVPGVPLKDLLEVRRLPFQQAAALTVELADALEYAHSLGVVHRDIKPANIMLLQGPLSENPAGDSASKSANDLSEVGKPMILDFGLALREAVETTMTMDGHVLGTPAYMSPEQAAGRSHQADRRSDVYSLGVVLYQMLTGELPFRGSRLMLLSQVMREEPRAPRKINDKIPRDLETICLKCLRKEPGKRYATARDLAEDLRCFQRGDPIQARPMGRLERTWRWCRRNSVAAALTATVALFAVCSTVAAIWLKQERDNAQAAEQRAVASEQERLANLPRILAAALAEQRAVTSERERRRELFRAYLSEARTRRGLGGVGQRENGLSTIRKILAALPREELTEAQRAELRDEALGYLSFADVRETLRRPMRSANFVDADINPAFEWVACRGDKIGETVIGRLQEGTGPRFRMQEEEPRFLTLRAFSPDGRWLVEQLQTVGKKYRLRIWDCRAQQQILNQPLLYYEGATIAPAFRPNASEMLVQGPGGTLLVLELPSGRELRRSPPLFRDVRGVAFSGDGKRLALAGDFPAQIVDVETWQTKAMLREIGWTTAVAWNPVVDCVVFGNFGGALHLWDLGKDRFQLLSMPHASFVTHINFSADGTFLASSAGNNTFTIRHMNGDRPFATLPGRALRFSANSRRIAFADGGELQIGELAGGSEHVAFRVPSAHHVDFSPDGRWLAVAGHFGVTLFAATDCSPVGNLGLDPCGPVSFHPESRELVSFGLFSQAWRWPLTPLAADKSSWQVGPARRIIPLEIVEQFSLQPQHYGRHAVWSRDGKMLVLADNRKGRVLLTDSENPAPPRVLAEVREVVRVAISPNKSWVASGVRIPRRAQVWNAADGKELLEVPGHEMVAFSADDRWFASASREKIHLYRTQSWQKERVFERDETDDFQDSPLALQPGGRLIAFAASRRKVRLCEVETGRIVANLTLHDSANVSDLNFSPDGTRLAYTSGGTQVGVWDLHELRRGLVELGLGAEGLPERLAPLIAPQRSLKVVRGSKLPAVTQWREKWLRMAGWEASSIKGGLPDAIKASTEALLLLFQGETRAEGAEIVAERAEILSIRAGYYLRNGDPRAAREDWKEALQLVPHLPKAARSLARLSLLGHPDYRDPLKAYSLLAVLANCDRPEDEDLALLGMAQVRLGRHQEGMAILKKVEQETLKPFAGYFMALAQHQLREPKGAAETFAAAVVADERIRGDLDPVQRADLARLREETANTLGMKKLPGNSTRSN